MHSFAQLLESIIENWGKKNLAKTTQLCNLNFCQSFTKTICLTFLTTTGAPRHAVLRRMSSKEAPELGATTAGAYGVRMRRLSSKEIPSLGPTEEYV